VSWSLHHGEAWAWLRSLPDSSADALVTDPPYSSGGFTRGDRSADPTTKYRAHGAAESTETFSGDTRSEWECLAWLALWMTEAHRVLREGAPIVVATDWRQGPIVNAAIGAAGFVRRGQVTWTKLGASRPQLGRFRGDAEYFPWGSKGAMPLRGPALQGTFESSPGEDVYEVEAPGDWPSVAPEIACSPVPGARRLHLTEKPVLVMESIVGIVPEGALVLDPFAGSGSTGVACLRRGRAFAGCELSPHYHALASRRLEAEARGVDGTAAAKDGQLPLLGGPS
jgi:site-specific DNA-methyltransferase (adenine-specific)